MRKIIIRQREQEQLRKPAMAIQKYYITEIHQEIAQA